MQYVSYAVYYDESVGPTPDAENVGKTTSPGIWY
jgi:hypothetical protein